jgi:hypothetical protein
MILGLDISTTMVGVAIINDSGKLVKSDAWDILKSETLFNKPSLLEQKYMGFDQNMILLMCLLKPL